jgi:RimJ/RimL family protein N-acetyltransferase
VTAGVTRLSEADWRVFAATRLRALADSLGENDPQYRTEVTFTAAQWRRRLRHHAQFATLVKDRAVGLIAAQQENPESVYLYSLWVDPTVRGQGLARPLVAAAVKWACEQHVRTVTLRVATDNVAARAVYESLGFAAVGSAETVKSRDEVAMMLSVS